MSNVAQKIVALMAVQMQVVRSSAGKAASIIRFRTKDAVKMIAKLGGSELRHHVAKNGEKLFCGRCDAISILSGTVTITKQIGGIILVGNNAQVTIEKKTGGYLYGHGCATIGVDLMTGGTANVVGSSSIEIWESKGGSLSSEERGEIKISSEDAHKAWKDRKNFNKPATVEIEIEAPVEQDVTIAVAPA